MKAERESGHYYFIYFIDHSFQQTTRMSWQLKLTKRSSSKLQATDLSTYFIISILIAEANLKADYKRHPFTELSISITQNHTSNHLEQHIKFDSPTLQNPYHYSCPPNPIKLHGRHPRAIIRYLSATRNQQRHECKLHPDFTRQTHSLSNNNHKQQYSVTNLLGGGIQAYPHQDVHLEYGEDSRACRKG